MDRGPYILTDLDFSESAEKLFLHFLYVLFRFDKSFNLTYSARYTADVWPSARRKKLPLSSFFFFFCRVRREEEKLHLRKEERKKEREDKGRGGDPREITALSTLPLSIPFHSTTSLSILQRGSSFSLRGIKREDLFFRPKFLLPALTSLPHMRRRRRILPPNMSRSYLLLVVVVLLVLIPVLVAGEAEWDSRPRFSNELLPMGGGGKRKDAHSNRGKERKKQEQNYTRRHF